MCRWSFSVILVLLGQSVHAADLLAGAATTDITPPRGYRMAGYYQERLNTGTRDPLQAKALVLKQGDRQAALVFCDLVSIPRDLTEKARALAQSLTGIPAANIAIAATHSHTGPLYHGVLREFFHQRAVDRLGKDPQEEVDYPAELAEKLAKAIASAQAKAVPIRLDAGRGEEERISFNRRFHMKDGTVRFNPGILNPDIVRVAGPIDPDVGVLLARPTGGGRPLAALTVFALHLDTVGGTEYSADYPKVVADELAKTLGPQCVSLFGAGTCGDINHIDVKVKQRAKTEAIGKQLTEAVQAAFPTLKPIEVPDLAVAHQVVDVPTREVSDEEVAQAKKRINDIGTPALPFLEAVRTVTTLDLRSAYPSGVAKLEVQVFRLGADTAIVTLPGEIFVELGLAIKRDSPFRNTLVIELANSAPAYVPTKKAFAEGSYEIVNSRVRPGGGEQLVATALELLKSLKVTAR